MDWTKAKNILIIAFVVTSIFLAYILLKIKHDDSEIVMDDSFIEEVVRLLNEEDINIDTRIPRTNPKLPIISLEYETYESEEIVPNFLGSLEDITIDDEIYINGEETVKFEKNNKKLVYQDDALIYEDNKKEISKAQAIRMAIEFINNHGFDLKDVKFESYFEEDNIHRIVYNKEVDGIIIEETYMTVELSSNGITSFERYWIENIEKRNKNLVVSTAPKSLLKLLNREEYHGKTIEQIDLCYYFNVDDYKKSVSFNDSIGGVASPAWRFIFEDKEKVFLDENW